MSWGALKSKCMIRIIHNLPIMPICHLHMPIHLQKHVCKFDHPGLGPRWTFIQIMFRGPAQSGFNPSKEKYKCPLQNCNSEFQGDVISWKTFHKEC